MKDYPFHPPIDTSNHANYVPDLELVEIEPPPTQLEILAGIIKEDIRENKLYHLNGGW